MGQSLLSRLSFVGIARETTQGTYLAPTDILPVMNLSPEDMYEALRDESLRNNDSVLQGLYQGPGDATFDYDMSAYPDVCGHGFRAIVGPDTVTPGVSTTLSSAVGAGVTTISVAASIPTGTVIAIDTGVNLEYNKVTAVSGTGPYTLTLATATTLAHLVSVAVVGQSKHVFAQSNTRMPSYSLTDYDAVEARGFPGCILAELGVKIDPKGIVTLAHKWMGYPSAVQSTPTTTFTKAQPLLGWQWTMTNGGASSNRGLTLDWSIKREVESIHASTGTQAPEEVFPGALTMEGTYKARFDGDTDLNLFLNYVQQPVTSLLTQPVTATQQGASLAITTSQGGFFKGKINRGGKYIDADFSVDGMNNTTDAGTMTVTLNNFRSAQY